MRIDEIEHYRGNPEKDRKFLNAMMVLLSGRSLKQNRATYGICYSVEGNPTIFYTVEGSDRVFGYPGGFEGLYAALNEVSDEEISVGLMNITLTNLNRNKNG